MAQTYRLNDDTGCFLWDGTKGRGGRPIVYRDGQQTPACRDRWMALYGPLPRGVQLTRVCPFLDCVSPYHHVIRRPAPVLAKLGASGKLAAAVRAVIRARLDQDPAFGITWDGPLAGLECHPEAVEVLATDLRTAPLVVHCCYAQLVGAGQRGLGLPPDAAEKDAVSLDHALKALDKFGITLHYPTE